MRRFGDSLTTAADPNPAPANMARLKHIKAVL